MEPGLRAVIGATGGLLGGALAGLVAALLSLQAKRLRNAWLHARGRPGIKDAILPLLFVPLCAVASLLVGGILALFLAPLSAVLLAAGVPAGLLLVLILGFTLRQALG